MEKQNVRRSLRYDFTETERQDLSLELANKNQELRTLEDQKKSVVSEYGSRITVTKEHINSLSDKVASGYEIRDVSCLVEYHAPKRDRKQFTRTDTEEQWDEPMNDTDYNLFNQWEEKERQRLEDDVADNTVIVEEIPFEEQEEVGKAS